MSKNIVIVVLALVCLGLFFFALTQRIAAEQQTILAQKQTQLAEEFRKLAREQEVIAVASQREADNQRLLAVEMLAECNKKRK